MAITFAVDEVTPAEEPAATVPLADLVGAHRYLGTDGAMPVLPVTGLAPLLAAVHHAFAEHRPLRLSPDAVWLTIAQGVARHVRMNAEALRPRFVRHDGREELIVDVLVEPIAGEWAPLVERFRTALAERIGGGIARLFTCDFSTSGPTERTASEIVLLDAMSAYYDYIVFCVCGIPSVTLTGTVDDWRAIRARIDVIAELGLDWWTASLAPIADRLVAAAEGRPDVAFFRDIYKPQEAYGGDVIAGWVARLYPYVGRGGCYDERNPLLAVPLDGPPTAADEETGWYQGPGIRTDDVPDGMSRVVLRLRGLDETVPEEILALEGGLIAVAQDADGILEPRAGWVIRNAGSDVSVLINRIRATHPAGPGDDQRAWDMQAELRVLFQALGEVVLFEEPRVWRLLPPEERALVCVAEQGGVRTSAVRVLDLPDGTFVAILQDDATVVRLRADALEPIPSSPDDAALVILDHPPHRPRWRTRESLLDIPALDGTLVDVLTRALDTGGALDLPTSRSLLDQLPDYWDTPLHAERLVERLRREHRITGPADEHGLCGSIGPGELRALAEPWTVLAGTDTDWIAAGAWSARPSIALGDGTVLARVSHWRAPCVVRLRLDLVETRERRPARGRRPAVVERVTTEPASAIPVLGRSLVDVIEYALDHGNLPAPATDLADWQVAVAAKRH